MKIGVLTHHYVKNFGAYLQTYALINTISSINVNANVEVINFKLKKHEFINIKHFFGFKITRGDTLIGYIGKLGLLCTHNKYEKRLPLSKIVKNASEINELNYDLIVVGSDEVWNYNDIAYSDIKFGNGLNTTLVSYSASVGGSSYEDNNQLGKYEIISQGLKKFRAISVRDDKTEELVRKLVMDEKDIYRTLDPIFLYEYKMIVRKRIKNIVNKPYILIYDCHITRTQELNIVEYAKKKNMNIIGAGEYRKWYTVHAENITPYEWAFLFKYASKVITGTFHGAAFSIKYNKDFVAYLTEDNRIKKVMSLLAEFKLDDRIVIKEKENDLLLTLQKEIDYLSVNKILQKKINISIDYLRNNISKEENYEDSM